MTTVIKFTGKSIITNTEISIEITKVTPKDPITVYNKQVIEDNIIQVLKDLVKEFEDNNAYYYK